MTYKQKLGRKRKDEKTYMFRRTISKPYRRRYFFVMDGKIIDKNAKIKLVRRTKKNKQKYGYKSKK